jgi:hypothetical protein
VQFTELRNDHLARGIIIKCRCIPSNSALLYYTVLYDLLSPCRPLRIHFSVTVSLSIPQNTMGKRINHSQQRKQEHQDTERGSMLYRVWSWWGTYLGCCSQRDRAQTFRDKTGSLGRLHTLGNNPPTSLCSSSIIQTLPSLFSEALQTPTNSSTKQLLYIHYHTHGSHDKHLATMLELLTKKSINI